MSAQKNPGKQWSKNRYIKYDHFGNLALFVETGKVYLYQFC